MPLPRSLAQFNKVVTNRFFAPLAGRVPPWIVIEHVGRPERYTADTTAFPGIKEAGLKTFHGYLKQIDGMLANREWFSDGYSVLDPYGFVFYTWGVRRELPMGELKNYTAFKDRMLKRAAVGRVTTDEKIKV